MSRQISFQETLIQEKPIHITSSGAFSNLSERVASSWQTTIPQHATDTLAFSAAQVFYQCNEFVVSVQTLPSFVSWTLQAYKPSDLVIQIAVTFGVPQDPGGGNGELTSLLSMPALQNVRLIFQDYEYKDLGPSSYLRPSLASILDLKVRFGDGLKLQLLRGARDLQFDAGDLEDITGYLTPPTAEDERLVMEKNRVVAEYRGDLSNIPSILTQSGWSAEDSLRVIDLGRRVMIKNWIEDERLKRLLEEDVEMT